MDCSDCVTVLEHAVGRLDGVLAVSVNYAAQSMRVEFDGQKVNQATIERRVRSLGYTIPAAGLRSWLQENRELLFSLAGGLASCWSVGRAAVSWACPSRSAWRSTSAPTSSAGGMSSRHAFHALRERHFDTDLLMVIAALGAAVLGEFAEGALLLFLFSLGHALEERALDRARNAIKALADLAPKTALVRRNGAEVEMPVEQLQLDDVVIVKPGARLPVDGVVAAGRSAVNQAPVTGESLPVDKAPGDPVFAGTINGEGALEVRVTRLAKDSTLARVMQMVEEAQAQKSPTQQTVERFERIFVPAVLIGALLVIFVPPLFGVPIQRVLPAGDDAAGGRVAVRAGAGHAGHHPGRGGAGRAQRRAGQGRRTPGEPGPAQSHRLRQDRHADARPAGADGCRRCWQGSGLDTAGCLALAAALESRSGHPLAQAVVRAAQAPGPGAAGCGRCRSRSPAAGCAACVDGQPCSSAALTLLAETGVHAARRARGSGGRAGRPRARRSCSWRGRTGGGRDGGGRHAAARRA